MIDLRQSRATYHEKCRWWKRNENDDIETDELVMKRVADGFFMAKEVTPNRTQNFTVGGVMRFEKDTITIKSPDNLISIESEDYVEFRGELWRVVSVQRSKARNQNTYFGKDKNCSHFWYLELRK
jgi:hypothetical protein